MNKKFNRVLASGAVACLVLSSVPVVPAFAAGATDFKGSNRIDTAIKIAEASWNGAWKGSTNAVLTSSNDGNLVDALAVAPLAYSLKAPILLSENGDMVTPATLAELKAKGVKTVYISTGTGILTNKVEAQLKAEGMEVVRLGGSNRYETAKNIAAKLGTTSKVVVVNGEVGLADALSVASIAANQGMAIALTSDKDAMPTTVDVAGKTVYAIGGNGVLSDALVTKLGATRVGGSSRYATNAAVLSQFKASLKFDTTYLAPGATSNLVDSLTGSVLAAQTQSPVVLTDDVLGSEQAAALTANLTKTSVLQSFGGAVSGTVSAAVQNIITPGSAVVTGELKVNSVAANTAKTIKVTFNKPVADTKLVAVTAKRGNTPATLTLSWNKDNTEATLTSSDKLVTGDYDVNVMNDKKDMGTTKVSITKEVIKKITFNSSLILRTSDTEGKVGYKVENQYGEDITTQPLALNIVWSGSVDTIQDSGRNGVLKVAQAQSATYKGNILRDLKKVTITGYETDSNVSVNGTFDVSDTIGGIDTVKLTGITAVDKKAATEVFANTMDKYYLTFEAKDAAGNIIKDFDVLKAGLKVYSSNESGAKVEWVADKENSKNGALEVTIGKNDGKIKMTALSITSGKSADFDFDVKEEAKVGDFNIQLPSKEVCMGEKVELPFSAMDQYGKELTRWNDLKSGVNFTVDGNDASATQMWMEQGANGEAKLYAKLPLKQKYTLGAIVTKTGKMSRVSVDVKEAAIPQTIKSVNENTIVSAMTPGAVQNEKRFVTLEDQFGRTFSLNNNNIVNGTHYYVKVTSSDPSVIAVSGLHYSDKKVKFVAGSINGTTTVKYELVSDTDDVNGNGAAGVEKTIDTKIITMRNVDKKDITGYTINALGTMYAAPTTTPTAIAASVLPGNKVVDSYVTEYSKKVKAFGKLSNGMKVALADADKVSTTTESKDFAISTTGTGIGKVVARALEVAKHESTGSVTVGIKGYDGVIETVTAEVKSSDADPIVKDLYADICTGQARMDGDTIEVIRNTVDGMSIFDYDKNHNYMGAIGAGFYFEIEDQYGACGITPSHVEVSGRDAAMVKVNQENGVVTFTGAPTEFKLTAIAGAKTVSVTVRVIESAAGFTINQ